MAGASLSGPTTAQLTGMAAAWLPWHGVRYVMALNDLRCCAETRGTVTPEIDIRIHKVQSVSLTPLLAACSYGFGLAAVAIEVGSKHLDNLQQ